MITPSFAADKPPPPFHSSIGDDSESPIFESEVLNLLCEKTLIEAQTQIAATRSCISDIYEALNFPLFGDSMSERPLFESESPLFESERPLFDESQFPESESVCSLFDASCDDSVVPETEFEDLLAIIPDPGATEARGGDKRKSMAEEVPVMAEELESDTSSLGDGAEEMMRLLLPAFFKLVSSFLILLMQLEIVGFIGVLLL